MPPQMTAALYCVRSGFIIIRIIAILTVVSKTVDFILRTNSVAGTASSYFGYSKGLTTRPRLHNLATSPQMLITGT